VLEVKASGATGGPRGENYIMRVLVFIGALWLAGLVQSARAAPLTEEAAQYIQDEVFVGIARGVRPGSKPDLKFCHDAERKAAQYDRHAFFDAVIANCFGTLEARLGNKKAACSHYARAIERYELLPANDPYYDKDIKEGHRKRHRELGC
jgi:hypothetical protein